MLSTSKFNGINMNVSSLVEVKMEPATFEMVEEQHTIEEKLNTYEEENYNCVENIKKENGVDDMDQHDLEPFASVDVPPFDDDDDDEENDEYDNEENRYQAEDVNISETNEEKYDINQMHEEQVLYPSKQNLIQGQNSYEHGKESTIKNSRNLCFPKKFVNESGTTVYQFLLITKNLAKTQQCESPFICTICNKSYKHASTLKNHMAIHPGETPYKCRICKKGYNESGALKNHMSVHTGEFSYKCSICEKGFKTSHNLSGHMIAHIRETPFKCSVCKKEFRTSHVLAFHMQDHTGEAPYKCSVCEKRFKARSNLTVHMRIHSGKNPYTCSVCKKEFKQSSGLIVHMKVHVGKNP